MLSTSANEQRESISPLAMPLQLGRITLANRMALSLKIDQLPGDHAGITKAGLVMLELPGNREVPAEQLQRIAHAIRVNSLTRIGIPLKYSPQHPLEEEQAVAGLALQLARTIEADLIELDGARSQVPLTYILDTVRAVSRAGPCNGRSRLAPALAVRISTGGGPEEVSDDEMLEFAYRLKQHGCDLITIAPMQGGQQFAGADQLRQRLLSDRVRNEVGLPTMLVQASASEDEMTTNILAGRTDLYLLQDTGSLALTGL